jgi:hypothetical protein
VLRAIAPCPAMLKLQSSEPQARKKPSKSPHADVAYASLGFALTPPVFCRRIAPLKRTVCQDYIGSRRVALSPRAGRRTCTAGDC